VLYDQLRRGRLKIVRPRQLQIEAPPDGPAADETALDSPGAEALLRSADSLIQGRAFDLALRHLRAAKSLEPNSLRVQQLVARAEKLIQAAIVGDGVKLTAIPVLCSNPEDLSALDISPQEGFVLTRVNGSYDIQTILKITPVPPLEAQVVFWKLLEAGHIELTELAES
jgi:hypothetical protein